MKFIKKEKIAAIVAGLFIVCSMMPIFAHGGRTDKNGGHKDNNNVSGLGSYHYHCGGYPAHLHTGGVCPYASSQSSTSSNTTSSTSSSSASKVEETQDIETKVEDDAEENVVAEDAAEKVEIKTEDDVEKDNTLEDEATEIVPVVNEDTQETEEENEEGETSAESSGSGLGTVILLGAAGALGYKKFKK